MDLFDGQVYRKTPQGLPHLTAFRAVFAALLRAYGDDLTVSMQVPVRLDEFTKPEPDLSVLRGSPDRYDMRCPHPAVEIALVVGVGDSTLALDPKLATYAAAGIPEYWILHLDARTLQVCRESVGNAHQDTAVFREGERVTANGREIEVAALLSKV